MVQPFISRVIQYGMKVFTSLVVLFLFVPSFADAFTSNLSRGDVHPDVVTLKALLREEGYTIPQSSEASELFDVATESALEKFQVDHAAEILGGVGVINSLGTLDPLTRAYLNSVHGEVLGASVYTFTVDLKVGDTHPDVKELQKFLNKNGFVVAAEGPGSHGFETDFFGAGTYRAVKWYQEAHAASILIPQNLTEGTGLFYAGTRSHVNANQ